MTKLVLIGGGGHCRSCIDVIESTGQYAIHGILDPSISSGTKISVYEVLGSDELIPILATQGCKFFITVGHLNNNKARRAIFQELEPFLESLITIIAPSSIVSRSGSIGRGTAVMHQAIVNAGASIGVNCIINTGALIEHDTKIGDHSHIATNATINGNCIIGKDVFIGSGAVVINGIQICDAAFVAAGTVIHKSISEAGVYVGNPYHRIK